MSGPNSGPAPRVVVRGSASENKWNTAFQAIAACIERIRENYIFCCIVDAILYMASPIYFVVRDEAKAKAYARHGRDSLTAPP